MTTPQKQIDYNALAQVIDTTWGRSSTSKSSAQSVKFKMHGSQLRVTYNAIVNMVGEREMRDLQKRYTDEADQVIDGTIKALKASYKEEAGSAIKLKRLTDDARFEVIDLNIYNGKHTSLFRRVVVYEMS